jgi:hypothetical protein
MPHWTRYALVCAVTLSFSAAGADGVALPLGFDGEYVPDGAPCDLRNAISVKDDSMVGAEFAITVTDLIEDPVNPNRVEVTLLHSAGGEEWTESTVMIRSADGRELSFDYLDGQSMVWLRCPRTY